MKINSVYISAFGKFRDKRFDFTDGLNLIYGENEDGKTTLLTFISMMFYGSTSAKNDELYKSHRKKYAPRDNRLMAGSIDFESGGRKYRIERIFKTSNSTDKITVIDLSNGDSEAFTGKEDLGKRFLGLSFDAARRTVFLSSDFSPFKSDSADGELNARLSNLAGTGCEEYSAEEILSRLEKAKTALISKTGRGGKIAAEIEQLNELKIQLERARRTEQDRRACDLRLDNEREMLHSIQTEIERLTAHIKQAEGGKRYAKLKEYSDACAALESIDKKLTDDEGNIITLSQVSEGEGLLKEYNLLKDSLPEIKERTEGLEAKVNELREKLSLSESSEEIRNKISEKENERQTLDEKYALLKEKTDRLSKELTAALTKKAKIRPIFVVLTLISLLACGSAFIFPTFKIPLLIGGLLLTAVFIILTLTLRKKPEDNPNRIKIELEEAEEEKEKALADSMQSAKEINELIVKESVARQKEDTLSENFAEQNRQYKESLDKFISVETRIKAIEAALLRLVTSKQKAFSAKGMEIVLYSHKTNLQKKDTLEVKIAMLKKDLNGISRENAEKELSVIPKGAIAVGELDDLNERLIFKRKEYEALQQTIANDTAIQRNDFRFIKHPTELEKEIRELEIKIAREYAFCESVDIAANALGLAFSRVRETFGEALSGRTGEIFKGLTDGKYSALSVSKSFDILVEEKDVFGSNSWQTLSDGTIDQAYFALRLAVSELLSSDGERLPLILDDPFDRYDDNRLKKAVEFLKEYCSDGQALLFTCHKAFTENNDYITLK
ncbi:MAG: AAA family ATPase [Clostridia bacterium]|nr:AAA family ATPase [Clostridia bacterium]